MGVLSPGTPEVGTAPPTGLAGLSGLWYRLRGGTYPAFLGSRTAGFSFSDEEALDNWPGEPSLPRSIRSAAIPGTRARR